MYSKITFPELIELVAAATNTSKRMSELFLKELFATISQTLIDGENVKIKNLGTFKVEAVKPRKSVSVNTGQEVEIPMHNRITFTPAKSLADAINEPFAHFETVMLSDDLTDEQLATITDEITSPVITEAITKDEEVVEESVPADVNVEEETLEDNIDEPVAEEYAVEETEEPIADDSTEVALKKDIEESVTEEQVVTPPPFAMGVMAQPVEEPVEEEVEEEPNATCDKNDVEEKASMSQSYSIMEFEREKRNIARSSLIKGIALGALGMLLIVLVVWGLMGDDMQFGHTVQAIPADTIATSETDTAANVNAIINEVTSGDTTVKVQEPATELEPVVENKVVTDTATKTLYLTRMAKKHYGHKDFWVYIYEENKSKISNPNTVPPGTILVIPPASKYGIDANNPESVKKAHAKQAELFSKFSSKKKQ